MMQQMFSCPNCHSPVPFGSKFCGNCGTQLYWPTQQQMQPPPSYQEQQQPNYQYGQQRPEQKKTNPWLIGFLGLIGVIILIGGGIFAVDRLSQGTPPASTPPASTPPAQTPETNAPPTVIAFNIVPAQINFGENATLTWNVKDANAVTIDQGIGEVSLAGTKSVSPSENTTYTLTATNSDSSITKQTSITVVKEVNASDLALTQGDVESNGWVLENEYKPTVYGSTSTYIVNFINSEQDRFSMSVIVFATNSDAKGNYLDEKFNNQNYITDMVEIGDEGYFMQQTIDYPEVVIYYSMRFLKHNVHVKIGNFFSYEEMLSYARIVEARIP